MITIIPAIDIIDGRCVRLTQGDFGQKKIYTENIIDLAKSYEDAGLKRLHLVDLDGAKASFPQNLKTLEMVAKAVALDIQYGGGIKSEESLRSVFNSGATRAICGSIAVTRPEMFRSWLGIFGGEKIILGADSKDGFIATHGWLKSSDIRVEQLIEMFAGDGLTQVICTDISRDGMLLGPSFSLYESLQKAFSNIEITASGGIGSVDDIIKLNEMGLRSVIVGKAIYEGKITIKNIQECLQKG